MSETNRLTPAANMSSGSGIITVLPVLSKYLTRRFYANRSVSRLLSSVFVRKEGEGEGEQTKGEETRGGEATASLAFFQYVMHALFVRRMKAPDARTVDARPPAPRPHPPGGIRRVSTVLELELRLPHARPLGPRHVAPRLWGIRLSLSHAFGSMKLGHGSGGIG